MDGYKKVMELDNVTKKGGEAAIEWIGRILESI
jgi:hypothetical protein